MEHVNPLAPEQAPHDYRAQYRVYGEQVRWWKGSQEQPLPDDVRVLIYQNRREIERVALPPVPVGQTMISVLPDEIHLTQGDRILATQRLQRARTRLRREAGSSDVLPIRYAVDLAWVVGAGRTYIVGEDVALSADGRAVEWLDGGQAPGEGQEYGLEWTYRPMYVFLGELNQDTPGGGGMVPQIGLLRQATGADQEDAKC